MIVFLTLWVNNNMNGHLDNKQIIFEILFLMLIETMILEIITTEKYNIKDKMFF
jgi:hypothetical protein